MKNGDQSAVNFIAAGKSLARVVSGVSVDELSIADARRGVELANELERCLATFKSRCAAQVASHAQANNASDSGAGQRAVRSIFTEAQLSKREVKQEVAKVEALERLPKLSPNLAEVSPSNFSIIARHTSRLSDDDTNLLNQTAIVSKAKVLPPDNFEKFLRTHIQKATSDPLSEHKAMRAASKLNHWLDAITGMGHIHAELDPERYERIANKIDRQVSRLASRKKLETNSTANSTKDAHLAADAFCDLIGTHEADSSKCGSRGGVTSHGERPGTGGTSYQQRPAPGAEILVVVDYQTLKSGSHDKTITQTETGAQLADETIERLACDAVIRKVETDRKGLVLNVGRKQRVASDAQWAATKAMYTSCGWHGCNTRTQHCQLHHIKYWRNGGKTDMVNLVPLCSQHHHKVHEGGWSLKLKPDRSLQHFRPDKTLWKTTKPPNRLDSS